MTPEEVLTVIHNRAKEFAQSNQYQDYKSDLTGLCAISAISAAWLLRLHGHKNAKAVVGKFLNKDHCWVMLDNKVIDPTSTQFQYSQPHILDLDEALNHGYRDWKPCIGIRWYEKWYEAQKPNNENCSKFISPFTEDMI